VAAKRSPRPEKRAPAKKAAKRAPAKKAAELVQPRRPERPRRHAPDASIEARTVSWWDDFYRVVRLIPPGRVTTYGVVATLGGHPRAARHVGFALAALAGTRRPRDVPWQRVLGAAPGHRAHVTIKDPVGGGMQRAILEAEGVVFDARGRTDLGKFGWAGPRSPSPRRERPPSPRRKRALP
jgi:methylated-DNA-protein-cysteine methyltransferase-like protein